MYAIVFSCPASSDVNNYSATEAEGTGNETALMNACMCVCVCVCACSGDGRSTILPHQISQKRCPPLSSLELLVATSIF